MTADVTDRVDQIRAEAKNDFLQMSGEFSSRMNEMTGYVTEQFGHMTEQMNRMSEVNRSELAALTSESRRAVEQMTEEAGRQISEKAQYLSQQSEEVKQTMDEIHGHVSVLKDELSEKIHTEDVKCFRNIKDLLDEQKPLFENVKVNEKSMKPVKKYMYWLILFGVLDLAGVVALVLMELGVF